jgi:chaperonin GroEL (HSP60 family)
MKRCQVGAEALDEGAQPNRLPLIKLRGLVRIELREQEQILHEALHALSGILNAPKASLEEGGVVFFLQGL